MKKYVCVKDYVTSEGVRDLKFGTKKDMGNSQQVRLLTY